MKFMHPDFAAPFSFEGGGVCAYVFENPAYFRRMTGELIDQLEGERGAFVLSGEDGELMELGRNAELIFNPFRLPFEQTRIQSGLIKDLSEAAMGALREETMALFTGLGEFVRRCAEVFGEDLTMEETYDPAPIFKAFRVRPEESGTLPERLLSYFHWSEKYNKKKLFVLPNLTAILSPAELKLFHRNVLYEGFCVLLFESVARVPAFIPQLVIDEDLCEI